jgi:hypothetical protein
MPYATKSELPESVTNNLPAHAQDIYRRHSTTLGMSTIMTSHARIVSLGEL